MPLRVIAVADLLERSLEEIADRHALADMDVAEGIHVHASGIPQIFMRARREAFPGRDPCDRSQPEPAPRGHET